jgi:hypothetical protein
MTPNHETLESSPEYDTDGRKQQLGLENVKEQDSQAQERAGQRDLSPEEPTWDRIKPKSI